VDVRGRASLSGAREVARWTDLQGRGHDSRGHKVEIEEHVKLGERGSGRRGGGKGEIQLVENDVTRDEDSM
jgi:hypothetical protein